MFITEICTIRIGFCGVVAREMATTSSGGSGSETTFNKEEIKRNLFNCKSPTVEGDRMTDASPSVSLMNRVQIDYEIEMSRKLMQKDGMHENRMKQLRQKLKNLGEDDWMYPSVDRLLGLN